MNQTILVALIGTTGIIVGAILTFMASAFTAQQKIKELDIAYRQKLDENYLANARYHIDTLYIPLNISLTKLDDQYDKTIIHPADDIAYDMLEECFRQACIQFIDYVAGLFNEGRDAYLTTKLEEYLRSFTSFIKISQSARIAIVRSSCPFHRKLYIDDDNDIMLNRFLDQANRKLQRRKDVILAPINSPLFALRFEYDINELKAAIKEVTLGTIPLK